MSPRSSRAAAQVAVFHQMIAAPPWDAVLDEVHASNMTKEPGPTGKAVKGVGYRPPDISTVLAVRMPRLRYPTGRPGWLGEFQSWPCGRCGRAEYDEPHDCVPSAPCGECGALVPTDVTAEANGHHADSCSLHPTNVTGG